MGRATKTTLVPETLDWRMRVLLSISELAFGCENRCKKSEKNFARKEKVATFAVPFRESGTFLRPFRAESGRERDLQKS